MWSYFSLDMNNNCLFFKFHITEKWELLKLANQYWNKILNQNYFKKIPYFSKGKFYITVENQSFISTFFPFEKTM